MTLIDHIESDSPPHTTSVTEVAAVVNNVELSCLPRTTPASGQSRT